MITKKDLADLGFEEDSVHNDYVLDLGRKRELSVFAPGFPNEKLSVSDYFVGSKGEKYFDSSVCLHNYNFDGYLTKEKLETLISCIGRS